MGAKPGNRNGMRHGCRAYLASGALPKGSSYVRRLLLAFRTEMEAAVMQKTGGLTPYQAALIQSAVRHEARALLLQRWLKTSIDTLSVGDKLAFLRDISAATGSRDACLRQAGLDRTDSAKTTLDALYNVGGSVTDYDEHTSPPAAPASPASPATEADEHG